MNTPDADLLHLFESLTTEQKIDIARRLLQNKEIKSTTKEDRIVPIGTVLINNNDYLNYKGEVLVACKDIALDNRRNVIATVCNSHIELLKYIKSGKKFKLEE